MLTITKEFQFGAAHRLWSDHLSEEQNFKIYGKCSKLHGHTYRLQVTVSGTVRDDGMILNFTELKTFVQETFLSRYDHAYLNELEEYNNLPVTAENMVSHIYNVLDEVLSPKDVLLQSVVLYETPTSWATMTREGYRA
ncbi:MAG: 6-carboxytetrahydropterin synthase [Desulfobulbaceae bacterium]|nr:6-carboxytetrahydropterin synthase [Desulfobulbaceae bacterium]